VRLCCEPLELRQLLSGDAPVSSIGQISAVPALDVTAELATGPTGLTPQQIQDAYGINLVAFSGGTIAGNGAGETIAIVDAYKDPSIASDLAAFDKRYGLEAPPSLTVDNLGATTADAGWDLETSLDVEWAHAIAPAANIILVEAASSSLLSLLSAVGFASRQAGVDVVSMSWGTQEFLGESGFDSLFETPSGHNNVTFVAASGDTGAWYGPEYPSVSPNVLAVGGTTLALSSNNTYGSESGWSGSTGGFSGFDGNFWSYEPEPSYQTSTLQSADLGIGARTTPDVAFNADPNSGVSVYDSTPYDGQSGWFQLGGTSAAAPAWAGLVAIADQGLASAGKGPLSTNQLLTELYALPSSDFNAITGGYNGYYATAAYNLVTGLGSPRANLLVAGLLAASGVSESSVSPAAASTATTTAASSAPTATSHHHVRHEHHSHVHRADVSPSPTTGTSSSESSTGSGTSGSASTAHDASNAATTSGGQNSAPAAAGLVSSLLVPETSIASGASRSSAYSPGDTSARAPAQGPAAPGTLGQSVERPELERPDTELASVPLVPSDDMENTPPRAARSGELPVSSPAATPKDTPSDPPVAPAPPSDAPSWDVIDEAIEQAAAGMRATGAGPIPTTSDQAKTSLRRPERGVSALVGSVALAAGGYRLLCRNTDEEKRRARCAGRFVTRSK
jgi:hypothetical protein